MNDHFDLEPSSEPQAPLLSTKLYVPHLSADIVLRPRLTERLNDGLTRRLTCVSAPAGFGKTTLLMEWIHAQDEKPRTSPPLRIAWLSLEESDDDLAPFLTYLIAALQAIHAAIGESNLALLRSQMLLPVGATSNSDSWAESFLATLLNDMARVDGEAVLIVDDYHAINSPLVHHAMQFLLEHLPPQWHIFVATRSDPPFPLARWRARDQLVEIRADDLRFTPEEANTFLHRMIRAQITAEDVGVLEQRTEGWIVGLKLAALSLRTGGDVSNFVSAFRGDDRYVLDYLTEEVLQRQPEVVQRFLLHTSILDRLCGSLCDAVMSSIPGRAQVEEGGQAFLEMLEQANLFIVPLDHRRRWYRYHHLFADLLRQRLLSQHPERVGALHRRAAEWYEGQGLLSEAVSHAIAGADYERAARWIERLAWNMLMRGEVSTFLGWLLALPQELLRARPQLRLYRAFALVSQGQIDTARLELAEVESQLAPIGDETEGGPTDPATQLQLDLMILVRASLAAIEGDASRTLALAQKAMTRTSVGDPILRNLSAFFLGSALFMADELKGASQVLAEIAVTSQKTKDALVGPLALGMLGQIQILQGQLHKAMQTFEQGLTVGKDSTGNLGPYAAVNCIGIGRVLCEWNDLESAARQINAGIELGKPTANFSLLGDGYLTMARVKQAQDDADGANEILESARALNPPPLGVLPIQLKQVQLWLAQGNLTAATSWGADKKSVIEPGAEKPSPSIPFQNRINQDMTLARVRIAERKLAEALQLLNPALPIAESHELWGVVLELRILQALAYRAQGDLARSFESLQVALALAEPEGYVRIFLDEGEPMRLLMADCELPTAKQIANDESKRRLVAYRDKLLAAFGESSQIPRTESGTLAPPSFESADVESRKPLHRPQGQVSKMLVEPLSERELEVLRLLAAGMSNQEMAQRLVITVGTIKSHVHHIYSKLGAKDRLEAALRAKELGLLP